MSESMIERVARAIAKANGDEFANAFKNKSRWIAKRGMSGGRFRDVNEPFQSDYIDMACAAIEAMRKPTDAMLEAGKCTRQHWQRMIDSALSEREKGNG